MPADPRTGFARYDDAIAGKAPWLTDSEAKAGFAELIAQGDPKHGSFTTKRVCGDAAKKAADAFGAVLVTRSKDTRYEPTACRESGMDANKMGCLAMAIGDDDITYYLEYQKTGDTWKLTGVHATTIGNGDSQQAAFDKLLRATCK